MSEYPARQPNFNAPVDEQLLEEACIDMMATAWSIEYDKDTDAIPSEFSLRDNHTATVELMEIAEAIGTKADSWTVARRGLRKFIPGYEKSMRFNETETREAVLKFRQDIIEEVSERRIVFNFSDGLDEIMDGQVPS